MQSVASKYTNRSEAKALLTEKAMVPLVCLVVACDTITAGACFTWEIDTILDELEEQECLPDTKSRDRLLAGIACLANPAHLWSAGAFMAVAQTINGNLAIPEIWEPLSPAQLAYALNEINSLNQVYNSVDSVEPLYGEEPRIYMSGCLYDSGFPQCPEQLSLCSEQLERFYDKSLDIKDLVANPVAKRKLDEVSVYVSTMSSLRAKKMATLKG